MKTFIKITTFTLSIILILSLGLFTYYFIVTNDVNLDSVTNDNYHCSYLLTNYVINQYFL